MKKIIITTGLFLTALNAYAGWFSNPEVDSVNIISPDTFQICFKEPFKSEHLIYALDFETKLGHPFSYGGYYQFLLAKNSDDLCSYKIRLYDYFDQGNNTPKELWKILPRIQLSSFEKITVKVATPEGRTALTKTQPDEVIFQQDYNFSHASN